MHPIGVHLFTQNGHSLQGRAERKLPDNPHFNLSEINRFIDNISDPKQRIDEPWIQWRLPVGKWRLSGTDCRICWPRYHSMVQSTSIQSIQTSFNLKKWLKIKYPVFLEIGRFYFQIERISVQFLVDDGQRMTRGHSGQQQRKLLVLTFSAILFVMFTDDFGQSRWSFSIRIFIHFSIQFHSNLLFTCDWRKNAWTVASGHFHHRNNCPQIKSVLGQRSRFIETHAIDGSYIKFWSIGILK